MVAAENGGRTRNTLCPEKGRRQFNAFSCVVLDD